VTLSTTDCPQCGVWIKSLWAIETVHFSMDEKRSVSIASTAIKKWTFVEGVIKKCNIIHMILKTRHTHDRTADQISIRIFNPRKNVILRDVTARIKKNSVFRGVILSSFIL